MFMCVCENLVGVTQLSVVVDMALGQRCIIIEISVLKKIL